MPLEKVNALIVDDVPNMRTLVSEILKAAGVRRPREAADGDAAYEILKVEPIDVIFLDLLMKPVGGLELVRRIRTAPESPNVYVPIIVISGQTTEKVVAEARDAGVNEVVAKPITARAVLERLKLVIEQPRPFVRTAGFVGPDRRRRAEPSYQGPFRRSADRAEVKI